MSWSELERLVEDAETDGVMRRALRHCRSRGELLLAAQRLGFAITSSDLQQAWTLERPAEPRGRRQARPSPERSVEEAIPNRPNPSASLREVS